MKNMKNECDDYNAITININILLFKNEKISYMLNSNLIRIEKFIILFIIYYYIKFNIISI